MKRSLKFMSVASVLLILGAAIAAWNFTTFNRTPALAASAGYVETEKFGSDTVTFTPILGSSATFNQGAGSIDTGQFTMARGGKKLGTIEAKVYTGTSRRGINGMFTYTVKITSTIPGVPSFSSSTEDYPTVPADAGYS